MGVLAMSTDASRVISAAGSAAEQAIVQSARPPFMSWLGCCFCSLQCPIGIAWAEGAACAVAPGDMLSGMRSIEIRRRILASIALRIGHPTPIIQTAQGANEEEAAREGDPNRLSRARAWGAKRA